MMVFSGGSTARLKWAESIGLHPSITVRRYALKAFVVSLSEIPEQQTDK